MRVNFKEKEIFKLRFKRNPKEWTIDMVHNLYLLTYERHLERRNEMLSLIDQIVDEVKSKNPLKRIVYYTKNNKNYEITFHFNHDHNSWGYSQNKLEFTNRNSWGWLDDESKHRDKKLEFVLATKNQLELGQKFINIKENTKFLHKKIKLVLSDMIQTKLRNEFKGVIAPNILMIKIGDHKYYVECSECSNTFYKNFELLNQVENVIELT